MEVPLPTEYSETKGKGREGESGVSGWWGVGEGGMAVYCIEGFKVLMYVCVRERVRADNRTGMG